MANDIINGSNIGDAPDGNGTTFPAITLVNNRATITGSTGFAGDDGDAFAINAPAGGVMTIRLTGLTSDLDLAFYDRGGEQLDISWRYGANNEAIYFNTNAYFPDLTYYIEVTPNDGGSNYTIDVEFSTVPIAPELFGESDRVNGYGEEDAGYIYREAMQLSWDSYGDIVVTGSTGYYTDSRDWYYFYPLQSGTARLLLSGLYEDLDLYLINGAADTILEQSINDGIANEEILFNVIMGEKYYVAIDNIDEGSSYQLTIDIPGQDERTINPDSINGEEFSDAGENRLQAIQIDYDPFGKATLSGATGFGPDAADWYYFNSRAEGVANLTLTSSDSLLFVQLYNSDGALIASTDAKAIEWDWNIINQWIEKDETYYLRVKPLSAIANYSIDVDLPKPPPITPEGGSGSTSYIDGTDGYDFISGFSGKNVISAGPSEDMIWGGPQDDIIDGGDSHLDIILLYGLPDEYRYQDGIISGVEGNDTVTNIEYAGFGFGYNTLAYEVRVPLSWLEDSDGSGPENSKAARVFEFSQSILRYLHGGEPTTTEAILQFKEFADLLTSFWWELVEGTPGNDSINISESRSGIIYGGSGDDTIYSGSYNGILIGGQGSDIFKYTTGHEISSNYKDVIKDYSSEDFILFEGMSGITYYPGQFKYDPESTMGYKISSIENIENQLIFFNDGSDGYLYVKGNGTGIGYDGTLIKLENTLTAPTVMNVASAPALNIPEMDSGYKDLIEMYVAIAGRAPDAEGLNFWRKILDDGNTIEYVASQMWETEDAKAIYPRTMDTFHMVVSVYDNVLERVGDNDGFSYWMGQWDMNGPVETMLEMINAINGYDGDLPEAVLARNLFIDKVAIGGYLAVTLESDDLALAKEAFALLSEGNSIEATVLYLDQQVSNTSQVIGQSSVAGSEAMLS